jgi:hypothetical protein
MTIKYKLGFTIDSQTLFGIMAKFLPISDLSVEEVVETKPDPAIRFDKRFDLPKPKPVRAPQVRRKKGSGYALNLYAGCNAIVMETFADGGSHTGGECFPAMKKAGYATNGLYGRLDRLRLHGYVMQPRPGQWQLTPKGKTAWGERPAPSLEVEDRA